MTKLSVNLNKVALLRNARNIDVPSVTKAAIVCIEAGAHGITVHPRPDQRHIHYGDVTELATLLKDFLNVEFNVEGNPFPEFMEVVRKTRPTQCTLVPDNAEAKTSDHGWNIAADGTRLKPIIEELKDLGIRISLFMDADVEQIELVPLTGADRIELYTESYASAFGTKGEDAEFERFARTAEKAQQLNLGVNAGHDLNLRNLPRFSSIPGILEVSIGHALVAEALEMGMKETVRAYLKILSKSNAQS